MKLRQNEFIIGLSVTIATLIVILSILWLGKSNFLVKGIHLNMLVDNAAGLSVGDEVLYKGLPVGTVQDTKIEAQGIVIKLKIEKIKQIPRDSRFVIRNVSLLGEMAVEIIPGNSGQYLRFGETVKGQTEKGFMDMVGGSADYKQQLNNILQNLNVLFGQKTFQNLNGLLTTWQQTANNLNLLLQGDVKQTLSNAKEITAGNKKSIQIILDSLAQNAHDLNAGIRNIKQVSAEMNKTLKRINQGKGTLGKMTKEDSLYHKLNKTVEHLDSLILDIKKHPAKYFKVQVF